jgi:hypothetical protein
LCWPIINLMTLLSSIDVLRLGSKCLGMCNGRMSHGSSLDLFEVLYGNHHDCSLLCGGCKEFVLGFWVLELAHDNIPSHFCI